MKLGIITKLANIDNDDFKLQVKYVPSPYFKAVSDCIAITFSARQHIVKSWLYNVSCIAEENVEMYMYIH